jgi:hypothetical protein
VQIQGVDLRWLNYDSTNDYQLTTINYVINGIYALPDKENSEKFRRGVTTLWHCGCEFLLFSVKKWQKFLEKTMS